MEDRHMELANITGEMLRALQDAYVQQRPVTIRQTVIFPTTIDEESAAEMLGVLRETERALREPPSSEVSGIITHLTYGSGTSFIVAHVTLAAVDPLLLGAR
jgi:hypothetical protein